MVRVLRYWADLVARECVADAAAQMCAAVMCVADCVEGDPQGWVGLRSLGGQVDKGGIKGGGGGGSGC